MKSSQQAHGIILRRRVRHLSQICQWLAVATAIIFLYALGYYSIRVSHRTHDERFKIETGSRLTDSIFAPAIRLERAWLHRSHPNAERLIDSALKEARSSNRKVLLALGAKSCLPCRQLEQFLMEQEPIVSRHFVVVKIDVDDSMLHGKAVQARYRTLPGSLGDACYFPWMAILDESGRRLVTSDDGPRGTIGLPHGGPSDRAWFLQLLRISDPTFTDREIASLESAALAFHVSIWHDDGE